MKVEVAGPAPPYPFRLFPVAVPLVFDHHVLETVSRVSNARTQGLARAV